MHTSILLLGFLRAVVGLSSLQIDTSVGRVIGVVNGTFPDVVQFLGVPFAEPPIGKLRWAPPVAKSPNGKIDATRFGHDCPQYLSSFPSAYNADGNEFNIVGPISEDCLSLSIWAPFTSRSRSQSNYQKLPVLVWLFGGAQQNGGSQVPYQNPAPWVQRSQAHIFVQVNYRLNIFGFPGAAGLDISKGANYGLLDQRLALEWVRSNIANFGGDVSRITLFGQSAGAGNTDFYNFAYPHDPIVAGIILSSGSVILQPGKPFDATHSNFTFVAANLGCGNLTSDLELECMRNVSQPTITKFVQEYQESRKRPAIGFNPVVDDVTVFANNSARASQGNFTRVVSIKDTRTLSSLTDDGKPAIHGTLNNEDATFTEWINNGTTVNVTAANFATVRRACGAVLATRDRYAGNATTFRYYYTGNFSNISPRPWQGAFHASELPVIFGTHDIARGPSTGFQYALSYRMQDLWLAFIQNPTRGLIDQGWPAWVPGGYALEFGWEGAITQLMPTSKFERNCIEGTLIPVPGAVPPDSKNFGIV